MTEEKSALTISQEQKELVCIVCPRGCLLTAEQTEQGIEIKGNFCPRGREYGQQELTNPMRVLTALMHIQGSEKPVSVRTDLPVPKAKLFECAAEIYRTHPSAPVRRGDILIRNLCGTGSNVVATRDSNPDF